MAFVYVIDSSALIDLKELYPQAVFPQIYANLAELIKAGRLISPEEVFKEIEKKDDEIFAWCKIYKGMMFVPNNNEILGYVSEIMGVFPALVNQDMINPNADPFVIALARVINDGSVDSSTPIVVAHEKRTSPVKIPAVCTNYGIRDMTLLEMFSAEGWKF